MCHPWIGRMFGMAAVSAVAGAASAASTVSVDPPPGYSVKKVAPSGSYVEAFEVSSSSDTDAGCEIGLQPSAPGQRADQAMLNATAATAQFGSILRESLSRAYEIEQIRPMDLAGVHGFLITGRPRGAPPPVQSRLYIFETPAGRTTISCVASAGQMERRSTDFDAIARGVRLPR